MGRVRVAMGRKWHRFQNEMSQNRRSGATGGGGRESGTNIASEVGEPSNLKGRTTRRGEVRAEVVSERYEARLEVAPGQKRLNLRRFWRCLAWCLVRQTIRVIISSRQNTCKQSPRAVETRALTLNREMNGGKGGKDGGRNRRFVFLSFLAGPRRKAGSRDHGRPL